MNEERIKRNMEIQEQRKRALQNVSKNRYLLEGGPGLLPPQTKPTPSVIKPRDTDEAHPDTATVDRVYSTSKTAKDSWQPEAGTMKTYTDKDSYQTAKFGKEDSYGVVNRSRASTWNPYGKTSPNAEPLDVDRERLPQIPDSTARFQKPWIIKNILGKNRSNFGYCQKHRAITIAINGIPRDYNNETHDRDECKLVSISQATLCDLMPEIGDFINSIESLRRTLSMPKETIEYLESRKRRERTITE
jgi:hypothetical protein